MPADQHRVEERFLAEISHADALAAGELIAATWPKPGRGPAERAQQLIDTGRAYQGPRELGPRSFLVFDQEEVIAHAMTFARSITVGAAPLAIATLGKVAAAEHRRGEGLGALIVQACFALVDRGLFPHCLFQTSFRVEPFYERLGCRRVKSRVVNSLDPSDPQKNPFWDEVVMRYPAEADWPEGEIDLNGPGY